MLPLNMIKRSHPSILLLLLACSFAWGQAFGQSSTLGNALDNTNLTWTTGGDAPWATNAVTFDGVDAAASGFIGINQLSWIQTTVNGPGTLSFWWRSSTYTFDLLQLYINDAPTDYISGEDNIWVYRTYEIPAGSHVLKWEYSRGEDPGGVNKVYLDQVKFFTGPQIPLGTALNTVFPVWTAGGNDNPTFWTAQTNMSHGDGIAAESGAIKTSQESWMETTVSGVTNVSFWWKVSSVTNQGWLQFYTNGMKLFQISGEIGWQQRTNIALNGGTNTLRWSCLTSNSAIGKLNRGWVDEVNFSPFFGPSAPLVLGQPVMTNGQAKFDVNFQAGWPCRVQYTTNLAGGAWTDLLATNTTTAVTTVIDAGATNSPESRFYRAVAP
jgi:hypothetical protein